MLVRTIERARRFCCDALCGILYFEGFAVRSVFFFLFASDTACFFLFFVSRGIFVFVFRVFLFIYFYRHVCVCVLLRLPLGA